MANNRISIAVAVLGVGFQTDSHIDRIVLHDNRLYSTVVGVSILLVFFINVMSKTKRGIRNVEERWKMDRSI